MESITKYLGRFSEETIKDNSMAIDIHKKLKELEEELGCSIIYCIKSGSFLHGTNTTTSDTDYTGIMIPNIVNVLLKHDIEFYTTSTANKGSKNTAEDTDITLFSIHKFLALVKKGDTNALDLLFSLQAEHWHEIWVKCTKDMKYIVDKIDLLKSKEMSAFTGHCNSQTRKYNIKGLRFTELQEFNEMFRTVERIHSNKKLDFYNLRKVIKAKEYNYIKFVVAPGPRGIGEMQYIEVLGKLHAEGITEMEFCKRLRDLQQSYGERTAARIDNVNHKELAHACRVILECEEYLLTNSIKFPLKDAEYLRDIKCNNIPVPEVLALMEDKLEVVQKLLLVNNLRDTVEQDVIDNIILDLLKGWVR